MRCECYRTDPATLVESLSNPDLLNRYLVAQEAELPALADRALVRHIRQMCSLAAHALASGMTEIAKQNPAATDELLSDLFAVATWQRWELPVERLADDELAVDGLPRGLLGADIGHGGASVWVIDHAHVALARSREADEHVERSECHH
ncbi:MAG: hypothetical protein AAB263_19715 [Planctomycetota bacterium]|mgnify:CR=1 FL=1